MRRTGTKRLTRAPLYTFKAGRTRVSKLRSSTGIYGKRVGGAALNIAVRTRKGRR